MKVWVVYEWDWNEIQVPVAAAYSSKEAALNHTPEAGLDFTVVELEVDAPRQVVHKVEWNGNSAVMVQWPQEPCQDEPPP